MIRRILLFSLLICNGITLVAQENPLNKEASLLVKIGIKSIHMGYIYQPARNINIPVTIGLSSNFTQKRYDDISVETWPNYQFSKGKFYFPIGIIVGGKYVKNFRNAYPLFYYGLYTGISYGSGRSRFGLIVGYKNGSHEYIIQKNESYALISAYETYRENPVVFMVSYSFVIK